MSQAFRVEKETQFLLGSLHRDTETGSFGESINVLGTVVSCPRWQGMVIRHRETGKIISLR